MTEKKKPIVLIENPNDRYEITKEKVIDMLLRDRDFAYANNKVVAAISVSKLFGDMIGLFKTQNDQVGSVFNFNGTFTHEDKQSLEALGFNFAKVKIDPEKF